MSCKARTAQRPHKAIGHKGEYQPKRTNERCSIGKQKPVSLVLG
jgi:hypothetical protein